MLRLLMKLFDDEMLKINTFYHLCVSLKFLFSPLKVACNSNIMLFIYLHCPSGPVLYSSVASSATRSAPL